MFLKTSYLNEEVECTKNSLSVSAPWCKGRHRLALSLLLVPFHMSFGTSEFVTRTKLSCRVQGSIQYTILQV